MIGLKKARVGYKTLLARRDRFLKGGKTALKGKGPDAQVKALENENQQLKEILAEDLAVGSSKTPFHRLARF